MGIVHFLSFTVEPMSADHEDQRLLRESRERGLQNLMSNPPVAAPPAPSQPSQTQSTRKKFKAEIRSKRNEERHKPEDPAMNPPGSVELPPEGFEDFGEDENVAPQRPPYLRLSLIDLEGLMIPMTIINIMKRKMTLKYISRRNIAE